MLGLRHQYSLRYSSLHLGQLRLNQSKCFEDLLQPVKSICSLYDKKPDVLSQSPSQTLKGFLKPPLTLAQSTTYCRLYVCWLIWYVVSDVTVFFLTYRDPSGQADEPMTLKEQRLRLQSEDERSKLLHLCESYALKRHSDPTTRLTHLRTKEMWTLHIQGDR